MSGEKPATAASAHAALAADLRADALDRFDPHADLLPLLDGLTLPTLVGIDGRAITGTEFAAMSDADALDQIDRIGVIAAGGTQAAQVRRADPQSRGAHLARRRRLC